jgi:hypothetical protein
MFFERDQEKKKMCSEKGISLVCIPYWYLLSFTHFSILLLFVIASDNQVSQIYIFPVFRHH